MVFLSVLHKTNIFSSGSDKQACLAAWQCNDFLFYALGYLSVSY